MEEMMLWHFFTETFGIKVRLRNLNRTVLRLVRHISTALFLGMVLYYPAPSPIIMVPVQQCKMAVVISKVKILLEIDPFFAEAWIMASRLDDHSRSCFWHPVRAGRPTALSGQTMTFKMLTPVTPGWASSRVRDRISGVGSFLPPTSLASLAKFSFVAVREVCFEAKNSRGLKEHRFSTQRRWKARSFEVQIREYHNLMAH